MYHKSFRALFMATLMLCSVALAQKDNINVEAQKDDNSSISIKKLQEHCLSFRHNRQTKAFQIQLECKGNYTAWQLIHEDTDELKNSDVMFTSTTTKGGRFTSDLTLNLYADSNELTCSKHVQTIMYSPEGMSIPITINKCEDLTLEKVQRLCKAELTSYCSDNHIVISNKVKADDGMCVLSTTNKVLNTCKAY